LNGRHISSKTEVIGFQCLDHPPYYPDLAPSEYHLFPGLKKAIEKSPFFVRHRGHCCRGDVVGRVNFRIFFEQLPKVRARIKRCIELCEECAEQIPSLVAVACFLPGRVKDLSATPRIINNKGNKANEVCSSFKQT
jgi:hypothetical protein